MALITKPLLTFVPKKKESGTYLGAVHTLQLCLALLGFLGTVAGLLLANYFHFFEITKLLALTLGLLVATQLMYDFYRKHGFASSKIEQAFYLDTIFYGGQLLGLFLLKIYGQFSLENVLFILASIQVSLLFLSSFFIEKMQFEGRILFATAMEHLQFSGWLTLTAILQWITGNYFILAAGGLLGAAVVGMIRIVQQLSGLCHILFLAMENLWPVSAAKVLNKKGMEGLISHLQQQTLRWALPLLSGIVLLLTAGQWLIKWLYQVDLTGNYSLIVGFSLIYIMVFLGVPCRIFFRTLENTKPIFLAYVVGATFSLLSAHWLLETFNLWGFVGGLWLVQVLTLVVYFQQYQEISKSLQCCEPSVAKKLRNDFTIKP